MYDLLFSENIFFHVVLLVCMVVGLLFERLNFLYTVGLLDLFLISPQLRDVFMALWLPGRQLLMMLYAIAIFTVTFSNFRFAIGGPLRGLEPDDHGGAEDGRDGADDPGGGAFAAAAAAGAALIASVNATTTARGGDDEAASAAAARRTTALLLSGVTENATFAVCDSMAECAWVMLRTGIQLMCGVDHTNRYALGALTEPGFSMRVMCDIVFFMMMGLLAGALATGVILDTFSMLRTRSETRDAVLRNECFVCGLTRERFDEGNTGSFDLHVHGGHSIWNYCFFVDYLQVVIVSAYST